MFIMHFPLSQAQCLGNKYPRVQMRNGVKHRDEVFCPRPHKAKHSRCQIHILLIF